VLLDPASHVLGDARAGDHAHLPVIAHLLRVEVQVRLGILLQRPVLDEGAEVLRALLVHRVRVLIRTLGQVDLGAGDVEEARRVAGREGARLGGVDHVVGRAGHTDGFGRRGAVRLEGSESCYSVSG
jgi:hypothetical protein